MCACRIYTGIHALKPEPKFKTGAISESTTALNVDQTNSSVLNVEQKNTALQLPPSSLATCMTAGGGKGGGNGQAPTTETGVSGSAAATPHKKESGLAKVQADKKKMDARKKSLKRLWSWEKRLQISVFGSFWLNLCCLFHRQGVTVIKVLCNGYFPWLMLIDLPLSFYLFIFNLSKRKKKKKLNSLFSICDIFSTRRFYFEGLMQRGKKIKIKWSSQINSRFEWACKKISGCGPSLSTKSIPADLRILL